MLKVLITGAGGFVGRHCLPRLAAGGAEVHAVVRPGSAPPAGATVAHQADLLDPAAAAALVAEVRPTHLLHLAWVATPGAYWNSPENLDWLAAGLGLLRAFARHGGRRAVLAGTCAEYDWAAGRCHETTTPLKPAGVYGACKNALREAAEAFARQEGFSLAWGRLFFLYGPHEDARRLTPSVVRALLRGEPAECSQGAQRRDFLHVRDAAEALAALLESEVAGPVNVGSGAAVAVRDVVRRLAEACGRPDLVRFGAPATNEAPLVEADVGRLRDEVGFTPRYGLEDGLAQTVAWWRGKLCEHRRAG